MEIRSRASKICKRSDNNRSEPYIAPPSNSTGIRQRSSTSSSKFSNTDTERVGIISASVSSSNNIFNRVTNSVSGLFSNVSWSEWLKSPVGSNIEEEEEEEEEEESSHQRSEMSDVISESSSSYKSDKSFNQLYPEEGIADFSASGREPSTSNASETFTDKPFVSMHTDLSSFKKGLSIISSTPSLSTSAGRKKGNEDFLRESIISKPSTSDFQNDVLPPKEESFHLLKKSFPESQSEPFLQSNGSMSGFPSSRKRLREPVEEHSADDDEDEDDGGGGSGSGRGGSAKRGRPFTSSPRTFTEQTEMAPEPQKRKRPRFSISTYGSPLYSNRTVEEEPSFSIFYPGKVMYGGAANHQTKKRRIIARKVCPRTPISISSCAEDTLDGGLSSAARRILNCIDKISTPLSDSKRIFPFTTPRDLLDSSSFVADFHKHRPSLKSSAEVNTPPVNKLLTPSKIKIHKNFSSLLEPKSVNFNSPKDCNDGSRQGHKLGRETSSTQPFYPSVVNTSRRDAISTYSEGAPKPLVPEQRSVMVSQNQKSLEIKHNASKTDNLEFKSTILERKIYNINSEKENASSSLCKSNEEDRPSLQHIAEDDFHYKFSEPETVSNFSQMETRLPGMIEFKFSLPLYDAASWFESPSKPVETPFSSWGDKYKPPKDSWECGACLLQNEGSKLKCIACETPKVQFTSSETSKLVMNSLNSSKHWQKFWIPKGSWDCQTCLLQNKEGSTTCVACLVPKVNKGIDKGDNSSVSKSVTEGFSGSWGDSFKPLEGSWECEMCLLHNKESASKCAACETAKPDVGSASISNSIKETPLKGDLHDSWGDAFKPSKGSWECAVCLLQNDGKSSNCVACQSAKPKISSAIDAKDDKKEAFKGNLNPSFRGGLREDTFGEFREGKINQDVLKGESSWVCSDCIMTNKNSEEKCVCCKSLKPSFVNDSPRSSRNSLGGAFGCEFFKAKDEWECETCLVRNKLASQKCISCETPRFQLSRSTIVSEALTGNFKFGVNNKPPKEAAVPPVSAHTLSSVKEVPIVSQGIATGGKTTTVNSSKFVWSSPLPVADLNPAQNNSPANSNPPAKHTLFKPPSESQEAKEKDNSVLTTEEIKTKPLFQFPSTVTPTTQNQNSQKKLKFPKAESNATVGFMKQSDALSNPLPKANPSTFIFFGNDNKAPSFTPFNPPNAIAKKDVTTSAASSNSTSLTFAFGQPNTKPLNTGFNFGEATSKPAAFNFGSSSVFQFGQQSQPVNVTPNKTTEPAAPSFLNIETPKPNPFNAATAPAAAATTTTNNTTAGPQRRIFKKAYRRNK